MGANRLMDSVYGPFTNLRPAGAGADCDDGWLKSRADVVDGGDASGGNRDPLPWSAGLLVETLGIWPPKKLKSGYHSRR